ncbi:MAG TPA: phage tail protein [Allosphingosinicella sp.]|nr:phage tail protein [Allosphingosinicella sp.]
MATLILTTVGTLVAGPIGGAIGAMIGQQVDQNILFAPKARQGPRLGDLSLQTSSYGTQIPKIFGTMRVAGTVIWATDLVEHKSTSGGKGRPKVTSYSYSASFAVALSARAILSVGRIWADGKLLRGAAGDLKSATGFRLHQGQEDQPADPLIVAAEGAANAPAFRGIGYVVFEDMQLEDFGNRIPSLTFEVVADGAPVPIGAVAVEQAEGGIEAGETPALLGYAATGDSLRDVLEGLSEVVPLSLSDDGETQQLRAGAGAPLLLPAEALSERMEVVRHGQGAVPGEVAIVYYDAARDYQTGLQRALRDGGRSVDRRSLAAVLQAGEAKALAAFRLASLWAGRVSGRAVAGWRHAPLRPGSHVEVEGQAGLWRVERQVIGEMNVTLNLVRVPAGGPPELAASPGRPTAEIDLPHGPTVLQLLDLPLGDGTETKPLLYVAAAGESSGWRRASLSTSFDGGTSWQDSATAGPAVMGVTLGTLAPAGSALFDTRSSVEVELVNEAMQLEGRSDDALAAGANLAAIGQELIQFGVAEPLGDRRFRLSRLLRGRRGTEWAAGSHGPGEAFTLIARETLAAIEMPAGALAQVLASGVGDPPDTPAVSRVVGIEVLRPPSPIHLRALETAGGDLAISWVRRSRQGWTWTDGTDAPLGEEAEHYHLVLAGPGFERIVETSAPGHSYTAAERAADGPGPLTLTISQAGSFAVSRAASLTLD